MGSKHEFNHSMSRQTCIKNQMPNGDHRDQSERDFMSEGRVEEKINTVSRDQSICYFLSEGRDL